MGINGIIGISQSGKTNILRALKLLVSNRPSGLGFVRDRKKGRNAIVEVEMFDGTMVSITKGKKKVYELDGEKYSKFGVKVPEEITEALNLGDINFHGQHDSPFLVFSKPSAISKIINTTTGMNDFDNWIDETNRQAREINRRLIYEEEGLEEATIALENLEGIEAAEKYISKAKRITRKKEKMEDKLDKIEEHMEKFEELEKQISKNQFTIENLEPLVQKAEKIENEIIRKRLVLSIVKQAINNEKKLRVAIKRHEQLLEKLIKQFRMFGKCPFCLGPAKQSTEQRIRDAFSITK